MFHFAIRDMLWFIVVAALVVCSLRDRAALIDMTNERDLERKRLQASASVHERALRSIKSDHAEERSADKKLAEGLAKRNNDLQMELLKYPKRAGPGVYFLEE